MKKEHLPEDTDKLYLVNGEIEDSLNQQSNVYVTKPRAIRKNGWLSQLELEKIQRQVEDEFPGEFGEDAATEVETVEKENTVGAENEDMVENEVESVAEEIVNVQEVNNMS